MYAHDFIDMLEEDTNITEQDEDKRERLRQKYEDELLGDIDYDAE